MFALEQQWTAEIDAAEAAVKTAPIAEYGVLAKRLEAMKLPRRHAITLRRHRLVDHLRDKLFIAVMRDTVEQPDVTQCTLTLDDSRTLDLEEALIPFPHQEVCDQLYRAAIMASVSQKHAQVATLLRKALRVHMIRRGRNERVEKYDSDLCKALLRLPRGAEVDSVDKLTRCVFCEESPACAALKLSLCARCRKVCYCSVGCQKAHWMMHKQQWRYR